MILKFQIILLFGVAAAFGQAGTEGLLEYWAQDDGVVISASDSSISGNLLIPEIITGLPVVKIDDNAFNNRDAISSLEFPSNLKVIDYRAFYKCDGITRVDLPEGVESLGKESFWQCNYITTVTIPASLTSIGEYAFGNCGRLLSFDVDPANPAYTDVDGVLFSKDLTALIDYPKKRANSQVYAIPDGTRSVNDKAFNGVWLLRQITLPDSMTHIGEYAFVSCGNWTSVVLPGATSAIGYGAFMNCRNLPDIHIPAAVEHIGDKAFESCTKLAAITVASSNAVYSSLGGVLYNKEQTRLINCPAGWAGNYVAPATLEGIGYRAFYKCENIDEIVLSDSVETIGDEAFRNCSSLSNLVFSSSLTTLGKQMFLGCRNLQTIEVDPANSLFCDIDGVLFSKDGSALLAYPPGRSGFYAVPDGVERIAENAFQDCDALTSLELAPGVTDVAREVFKDCANLVSIHMPGSTESLGRDVFDSIPNLQEINIGSSGGAFSSVGGILFSADGTELIRFPEGRPGRYAVPTGTESIAWHAFYKCTGLTSVSIPDGMTTLGNNAFSSSSSLRTAIFLGDAPVLGGSAFSSTASGFMVYHLDGANGFTSPEWNGYSADLLLQPYLQWNPGGQVVWLAQSGIDYAVQSATNLSSNGWNAYTDEMVTGEGQTNSVQPDYVADSELFRINVDLP